MTTVDRPLATFALFAYNQENYIREAVEGAFAQTYEPLEIILSDDCSSDRTFEIMQEMAAAYQGPHSVRVRQSKQNAGLIRHMVDVAEVASADYLVIAAGDDVSRPMRTEVLMRAFVHDMNTMAVFSNVEIARGSMHIEANVSESLGGQVMFERITALDMILGGGGVGKGASYAYRRGTILGASPSCDKAMSEDRIFPIQASVMGNVYHCRRCLLDYRVLSTGQSALLTRRGHLALDRPDHWAAIKQLLEDARRQNVISILQHFWLRLILEARMIKMSITSITYGAGDGRWRTIEEAPIIPFKMFVKVRKIIGGRISL